MREAQARAAGKRIVSEAAVSARRIVAGRARSKSWLDRRTVSLAAAVLWFAVGAGIVPAMAQVAAPELRVSAPATKRAGVAVDIVVTVANVGQSPVIVLPNAVRLRIEGAGAEYVPYPGPAVDPWAGARELAPGQQTTVRFPDASDRRGVWKLPPGDYRVIATYGVEPDLAPPPGMMYAAPVWRGRTESPPAAMTVLPAR